MDEFVSESSWIHDYEYEMFMNLWIWIEKVVNCMNMKIKKLISSYELYELQTEDQSLEKISQCRGGIFSVIFPKKPFLADIRGGGI